MSNSLLIVTTTLLSHVHSLHTMLVFKLIVFLFCAIGIEGEYTYYERIGGSLKFHRRRQTWNEARMRCHVEGGVLASPLNTEMLKAMTQEINKSDFFNPLHFFVGFHATFSEGNFFSIEGLPIEEAPVTLWDPYDQDDSANCITLSYYSEKIEGTAWPMSCDKFLTYMCYKEGVPNVVENGPCGQIDNGYKLDNRTGHCYKFHTTARTWSRAFLTCSVERAHLAVINSDLEAEVLTELFGKPYPEGSMVDYLVRHYAYVGVQDWGELGDWQTIHGQSLAKAGYSRFVHDKPSGSGGCLVVNHYGELNNVYCKSIHGFFCEKVPLV